MHEANQRSEESTKTLKKAKMSFKMQIKELKKKKYAVEGYDK